MASIITFNKLKPNYDALIASATILDSVRVELGQTCLRLLRDKATYVEVAEATTVPAAVLMAWAEREMSGNLKCYLGNGDPLNERTKHVPKNRGPFTGPHAFLHGCFDALSLDGMTAVARQAGGWSTSRFCYETESWNGWGYRYHGIPSPYLFGGTSVQKAGKFTEDNEFSPGVWDRQLGVLAIIQELAILDPTLSFDTTPIEVHEVEPAIIPHPVLESTDPKWVQIALNELKIVGTPLRVDGNIGRGTRNAVSHFQNKARIYVDGMPGPKTVAALQAALTSAGLPNPAS